MTHVAVVAGICVEHDAISTAVASQAELLMQLSGVDRVDVFAQHIDRELPCRGHVVADGWQLARHPSYRDADVAIFHWGIRYTLFDLVGLGGQVGPSLAVHFHNCTPPQLVADHDRRNAEQSIVQAQLLALPGTRVWTYSPFNVLTLRAWEVAADRIDDVPIEIEAPRPLRDARPTDRVVFASVGRIVPAKGQHVLLEATSLLPDDVRARVEVRIAGNATFGDRSYRDALEASAASLGIADQVRFVGQPDEEGLWRLYESSHCVVSTSLHEGLCVPVVEGYLAGCRAIGTDAGNLPHVVQPPDHVVPASDPAALATAMSEVCRDVVGDAPSDRSAARAFAAGFSRPVVRRRLATALARVAVGSFAAGVGGPAPAED